MKQRPPGDPGLPELNSLQQVLLPIADAFMAAMLSRPASGTLRTTRVTTVSIVLSLALVPVFGLVAVLLLSAGGGLRLAAALAVVSFALWGLTVGVFGLLQRRRNLDP